MCLALTSLVGLIAVAQAGAAANGGEWWASQTNSFAANGFHYGHHHHHHQPAPDPEPEPEPTPEPTPTPAPTPEPEPEPTPTEPSPEPTPVPTPTSPFPNPAPSADLLFKGTKIKDFATNQSVAGAVKEVPDPSGSGISVLRMDVNNSDVYPLTPTADPRAQLLSPSIFFDGTEYWWNSSFYLPTDFPASVPGWLTVLEGPYGRPFGGTPPWHLEISGDMLRWQRNSTYDWDVPWETPVVRGSWVNVLVHGKLSANGFIEMWVNGKQTTFFPGSTHNPLGEATTQRLNMKTMDASNDESSNFVVIQSYRELGMFSNLSLFQGPMLIGKTRASVGG